ncbi:MAG: aldehyde dehydrogenase family protein [Syntrophobacterales bacterium]|nr:aldehyde dehydrogenase family protein [Syntrophobacterales bacterium]
MIVDFCWIDGQEVKPNNDLAVEDPADRVVVARVPLAGSEEVASAVEAALRAFPVWRSWPVEKRSEAIRKLAIAIKDRQRELTLLISQEVGKPIGAAQSEVESAVEFLLYCAEEAKRFRSYMGNGFIIRHEPVGVCGIITPFNYPLSTLVTKIGPALSVGCSVVVKPDEHTPLSTLVVAKLTSEVGFPPGVVNVVTGPGAPTGEALLDHPEVRAISFTGSTEVGKRIYAKSSPFVRRLVLELGGNCPALVASDARWETFIDSMVRQTFKNSGQYCYRITRFIIHRSIYEEFVKKFVEGTGSLKVGHPRDPYTDLGPLNNRRVFERFCHQINHIYETGAKLIIGELPSIGKASSKGYFCKPLVFSEIPSDINISEEEFFGPVAFFFSYENDEEALRLANASKFGLAAYLFTQDMERINFWVNNLEAGSVWVNSIHQARFDAPFGGYKESGLGREKSPYGFESFTELKTVYWSIL